MSKPCVTFLISCLFLFSNCVYGKLEPQKVELSGGYIKAVPASSKMSAAYLTIKNGLDADVKLVAVKGDIAEYIELHTHEMKRGVMKMRQIPHVLVKGKHSVKLEPKGHHIMLIQLTKKLLLGSTVKLKLVFNSGGHQFSRELMFTVRKL